MSESNDSHDAFVDAALRAATRPNDAASLRDVMRFQTIGVLRFRRRMKKCLWALSFVGCYAAGMVTVSIDGPAHHDCPVPLGGIASMLPKPVEPPLNRQQQVRRNADCSLFEQGDVKEAVRHYDQYLKLASADQQTIRPGEDSWLLMALKDAKLREISDDSYKQ